MKMHFVDAFKTSLFSVASFCCANLFALAIIFVQEFRVVFVCTRLWELFICHQTDVQRSKCSYGRDNKVFAVCIQLNLLGECVVTHSMYGVKESGNDDIQNPFPSKICKLIIEINQNCMHNLHKQWNSFVECVNGSWINARTCSRRRLLAHFN